MARQQVVPRCDSSSVEKFSGGGSDRKNGPVVPARWNATAIERQGATPTLGFAKHSRSYLTHGLPAPSSPAG